MSRRTTTGARLSNTRSGNTRRTRSRRRALPRRLSTILTVLAVAALLRLWYGPIAPEAAQVAPGQLVEGDYRVERVVDGDTLVLEGNVRVRLIGADTPETVRPNHPVEPWGPEATEFTREWVEGRQVRIQFDGNQVDRYDRVLALVWVGDRMLNEELLRAGLARARTQYNYSDAVKARFATAESEAQAAGRGIWSESDVAVGGL